MDFGTAVHASCENFLKTRVMDSSIAIKIIENSWEVNKDVAGFEAALLPVFLKEAEAILADVPAWMDAQFPNWEFVDSEHYLYEPIEAYPNHAFKGYIDGVIKCPHKTKKRYDIWLLDWKTTSWGWDNDKKNDPNVKAQLVLYKNYWSKKTLTNPKHIKCGFILLKRAAKPGKHCELVTISVGEVVTAREIVNVNRMILHTRLGTMVKNRFSCKYCDFYQTEHCK